MFAASAKGFLCALVLVLIAAPVARAQEVLPFPPTPSSSVAGLAIQDSVHRKKVEPRRLPADAPNLLVILIDDVGPAVPSTDGGEIAAPKTSATVAEARVPRTASLFFTSGDCLDLGTDRGSPVSTDSFDKAPYEFNGKLGTTKIRSIE